MKKLTGSGGGGGGSTNTPDSLFSEDVIEFALAVSEGPIRGLQNGAQSFYVGSTPLVQGDGTTKNFDKFAIGVYPGYPAGSNTPIKFLLGGTGSNTSVNVALLSKTSVIRQTEAILRNQIDQLNVRLIFNRLLHTTDKGTFDATAQFTIEYKESSGTVWKDFFDTHIINLKGKTTSAYPRNFVKKVPRLPNDDWVIRVTKISADDDDSDNAGTDQTFVDIVWESFQEITIGDAVYPNTAVIHGLGVANGQFSSLPTFTGVIDGILCSIPTNYNPDTHTYDESTPWDGTFKLGWTDNPAWVLYDLIMNTRYGLAAHRPYINTDRYDFYSAGKWCDETVLGGRTRYTYNDIISEDRPAAEQINYVAGSFNALAYDDNNGTIHLLVDKDDPGVMLFTPDNVEDSANTGGFNYSYTDITTRYNDISVSFINPDLDWSTDVRRIPNITTDEANIAKFGRIPLDFIAVGCTNAEEAVRKAMVRVLSALTEVTLVSFTTARQGCLLSIFDVILVADPTMGWSAGGRIISHDATHIYFRDPIYMETTANYACNIQTKDGVVQFAVRSESIGNVTQLRLVNPYPDNAPNYAVFTLQDTNNFGIPKPFRVTQIDEVDGSPYLFSITAVEINRNKYSNADNLLDLPDYQYSYQDPTLALIPVGFVLESGDSELMLDAQGNIQARILASWQRPAYSRITGYEIQWKASSDTAWSSSIITPEFSTYISPVIQGGVYDVRLRSISTGILGRSDWEVIYNHTVVGKSETPPGVASFHVDVKADGTRVYTFSTAGQPVDVTRGGGYRIKYREAQLSTPWSEMTLLTDGLITSSPYQSNFPRDGIYDFAIESVDSSGNESTTALLFSDFIIGDADFIDSINGTSNEANAMNQLIAALNAQIASHKATTAQLTGDQAIQQLEDIASDNVLSAGEKPAVIIDYQTLISEKTDVKGIDAQADEFQVDRTTYDNAIASLTAYLGTLNPAWNDTTKDTSIDGNEFQSEWVNVYTVRQLLQNAITIKAKSLADAAGSAAVAAQQTADAAASDAANATNVANAANNQLAAIADDNILSAGEKSAVILDYNNLINARSGIVAQAASFSVSSAAFTTALTALTSYLQQLNPPYTTLGVDTPIVGATFRSKFADAYLAETNLLNAIAAKAKALADAAQVAANAAQATATAAQTAATNAYNQAVSALSQLNNISDDNVLSKSEKPTVYSDWSALTAAYSSNLAQANKYNVATTTYTNAISALNTYMASVNVQNYDVDTAIVRTTFIQKFQDAYLAQTVLLNGVATATAQLATWAGVVSQSGTLQTGTVTANAITEVYLYSFPDKTANYQASINNSFSYVNNSGAPVNIVVTASGLATAAQYYALNSGVVYHGECTFNFYIFFNSIIRQFTSTITSGSNASTPVYVEEMFNLPNGQAASMLFSFQPGGIADGTGTSSGQFVASLVRVKIEVIKK